MPELKFYYAPGACSLAPHILFHMLSLPFTAIPSTISASTTVFPTNFQHINPKLRVPVLCIDGETITETPAIMTAISSLAPDRHFLGRSEMETIRVYEWMNWLSGTLHGHAFGGLLRPARLTDDVTAYEGIKAKGRENVMECFDVIEGKLGGGGWAVGEGFTAVDAYLFVFWRWGNQLGWGMREEFPGYTRLVERLVGLDGVQKALEVEGIASTLE